MLKSSFVAHHRQQGFTAAQPGVVLNDAGGVDRQLKMPLQRFRERQRFAIHGDRLVAFQPQQLNQLAHQRRIVLIPHAQRIARLVAQTGVAQIDLDMAHIFLGITAGDLLVHGERGNQRLLFSIGAGEDLVDHAGGGHCRLGRAFGGHAGLQDLNDAGPPLAGRRLILNVGIHAIQQALGTQLRQLAVKIFTALAEEFVGGIAQAEHGKGTAVKLRRFFREQELVQGDRFFRWLPFPLGRSNHNQQLFIGNLFEFIVASVDQVDVELRRQQIVTQCFCDATRVTGLRRAEQRDRRRLCRRSRRCRHRCCARLLIKHAPEIAGNPGELGRC